MTEKLSTEKNMVVLDTPIKRGNTEITEISLRKPTAGELRGIRLVDLANLDVTAVSTVLTRITLPTLTKPEVEQLDPADFVELASVVATFLLSKKAKADIL